LRKQSGPKAEQANGPDRAILVILGAGKPYRGENPASLIRTSGNTRVLDWTLDAFSQATDADANYVGGYRLDEITAAYPDLFISVNPNWETDRSLGSLLASPLVAGQTTYVCYSDIVISRETVELLRDAHGDVVILADRGWRDRYEGRSKADMESAEKLRIVDSRAEAWGQGISVNDADAEYAGVMRLSPHAVDFVISLRDRERRSLAQHGIPKLFDDFHSQGIPVDVVEIDGGWAELNAPQDLARFVLGTKADTLARLRPLVRQSVVGDQVKFTVGEWRANRELVLDGIKGRFAGNSIAVRSSALTEDGWTSSNAGRYTSVLDVATDETDSVIKAIENVGRSYEDDNPDHQVLVQSMLSDVVLHGVLLTRTLGNGAPYYVVNYDDSSGSTETVTSGNTEDLKTAVIYRNYKSLPPRVDSRLSKVMEATFELEALVGHDALDIEFAVTADETVHVLQLRPLVLNSQKDDVSDEAVDQVLQIAVNTFDSEQRIRPHVLGDRTIFGVMPDWNPAEIIGTTPRQLARSLYQYLITDEVWAIQRSEYGYRDVRPSPLLLNFAGHPYIDARASFSSFIPATLPDDLAARLVTHYLDVLEAEPHLHDKVEFEIAFTCLTFDFDDRAQRLLRSGFSAADVQRISESLKAIALEAPGRCRRHLDMIDEMERRFEQVSLLGQDPLSKARTLLEDCRRLGTVAFAHLARAGFVATSLLRSLEARGITSNQETDSFLKSLNTVAGRLEQDGWNVADGRMTWDSYVERYGHLRPGTYEITSPSYSEEPERYLKPMVQQGRPGAGNAPCSSVWGSDTRDGIQTAIHELGMTWDVESFEHFLREAIEGRESSKFAFSRNLSTALDLIADFGEGLGVSRSSLSHIDVRDLLRLVTGLPLRDVRSWLIERSEEGERWHQVAQAIKLPPLIARREDLFAFQLQPSEPNFVTDKAVIAEFSNMAGAGGSREDLKGRIVLIPQADPGFDWLFGQSIVGLVTMYGGANSHMAVRAAEFGLPAAIGVGETLYETLSTASVLELDCTNQWLRAVR
jgi:choline kinase